MERITSIVCLLSLLIIAISANTPTRTRGRIPTNICDVTSRSELVDLQLKVDLSRIACEGGQFIGYECSRYWLLNNELVRKKLTFDWCKATERQAFRNWAGTSQVIGQVQSDFSQTLQKEKDAYDSLHAFLVNQQSITITQLLANTTATLELLEDTENTAAANIRINTFLESFSERNSDSYEEDKTRTFDSTAAEDERTLVHQEESNNRDTTDNDAANTRNNVSTNANELRSLDSVQELNTRDYTLARQDETRALLSSEHANIRQEMDSQAAQTQQQWLEQTEAARVLATNERALDEQSTVDTDITEETTTRNLVQSTEAANILYDAQQEDQTRAGISTARSTDSSSTTDVIFQERISTVANISATSADIKAADIAREGAVQSKWNSGAANILLLLAGLQNGIPTATFTSISMHLDLQLSYDKGFPAVNLYTDNLNNFMALRAVVNDTVTYNSAKYGSTSSNARTAASYWSTGESYRTKSSPDYRKAVEYYSAAYHFSVAPGSNTV